MGMETNVAVMTVITQTFECFLRDENGASAMEYSIIAGLISVACIGTLSLAGDEVYDLFDFVKSEVQGAVSGS
jgi:pilus assembly protein Flp/PilA